MLKFTLSNGAEIPALGIGTFLLTSDQAEKSVIAALDKNIRYYNATPKQEEAYAGMYPDMDGQK